MNSRILRTLLAASLALNIGFAGTAVYRHWLGPAPVRSASPASLPDRLGLTADQRSAWEALERPFLRDLSANWAAIRSLRQALLDEIFAAEPDKERLAKLQARIAALQDSQQKRVIAQLLSERSVLDERQRSLLKGFLTQEYDAQTPQVEHLHQTAK